MKLINSKHKKIIHKVYLTFIPLLLVSFSSCVAQVESFDIFLTRFSTDSVFQTTRVDFPLKRIFLNDETFELDSNMISKTDYQFNKLQYALYECSEAFPMIYDNFECELRDTDERVFRWKGFTGMDERYYFKRIKGKWFLIRIEQLGT